MYFSVWKLLDLPPPHSFQSHAMIFSKSVLKIYITLSTLSTSLRSSRFVSTTNILNRMDEASVSALTKQLAPPLTNAKYKGQAGRIGIFGGSLEYTGAPYFAAISSLKVGADLAHVFCMKEAATVIKSYSPELIVHPLLDDPEAPQKIQPWLDRLHVILIGPGLGREPSTFKVIDQVIEMCKALQKPLVIDADGLFYIATNPEVLRNYPSHVILTPNVVEFSRLVPAESEGKSVQERAASLFDLSKNITVICKGKADEIFNWKEHVSVSKGGSGRRCGGQGDLLAGAVSTFLAWSLQQISDPDIRGIVAGFAASNLIRKCNEKGFAKKGRSMTCSDMIQEIHEVFEELYELK